MEHCVAERVAQLVLLEEPQGDAEIDPLWEALRLEETLLQTLALVERMLVEEALCLGEFVEHCDAEREALFVLLVDVLGDAEKCPVGDAVKHAESLVDALPIRERELLEELLNLGVGVGH